MVNDWLLKTNIIFNFCLVCLARQVPPYHQSTHGVMMKYIGGTTTATLVAA